jgi:hypothetical protein
MKRTTVLLTTLFLLPACSGEQGAKGAGQPGVKAPGGGTVSEQQRIAQTGYFDIGTLNPVPPTIQAQVDKPVLSGVELTARPLILECLVDPRNRGAEKITKVVVDATLTDTGVDHKVTGQNLTPAGTACITAALGKYTGASAGLNAKNAVQKPMAAHIEVEHAVGTNPAVVLGTNEASDISGAIRLALPGWGDCLADWKSAAPHVLNASVKVVRPTPPAPEVTPAEVTFEPAGDPTADKVAACLKTKVMALKVKAPKGDAITVPHRFAFVHSGIPEMVLPGATPDLTLAQIELSRIRREAQRTVADGERMQAWRTYNAAVDAYKASAKDPKAPKVEVMDLITKCKALLEGDDKLLGALQQVLDGEDLAHKFTVEQKAKDPAWAPIEANSARQLAEAQKIAETMKNNRKLDEGACPKIK